MASSAIEAQWREDDRRTLTGDEFMQIVHGLGHPPNPEQWQTILAPGQDDLHVVAGPGTGKTTSLVLRILKMVVVDGFSPSSIIATTFTVKAAMELRSRLLIRGFAMLEAIAENQALPAGARGRAARLDINQIITNTIDGLCQQVLRDHREPGTITPAIVEPFAADTLLLRAGLFDQRRFRDDDLDTYLRDASGSGKFGWNLHRKCGVLRTIWDRRFHDQLDWERYCTEDAPEALAAAVAAYEAELANRHAVDFAMLENAVLDRLRAGTLASFTDSVRAVLVDEYQDTNLLQESLYLALASAAGAGITVVGDDDQSLYRFRGATVDLFRDFPERCVHLLNRPVPRTIFLHRNYRSTPAIIDFVNRFVTTDPAYQPARVPQKPAITGRSDDTGGRGAPILGLFRDDAETLAHDLAVFVHALFRGDGFRLPNGDLIRAAEQDGDLGDAALLCSSPAETKQNGLRLPGLLRAELARFSPPIELFNPRGQDLSALPLIACFGGLILTAIDADGTAQAAAGNAIGDTTFVLDEWRAASDAFLAGAPSGLRQFHAGWAARRPRRGAWPRSVPTLKLLYGLMHFFPELHDDPEGQIYLEIFTRQLSACAAIGAFRGDVLGAPNEPGLITASLRELIILFLAPIASGAVDVNEEMIEAFPRDRLAVLSIHQSKGLEFPLTIVDVGADFKTNHWTQAFKRFPRDGSAAHLLETRLRPFSPLTPPDRTPQDRAFDDLVRQYFVAFSRPEHLLLLVGLTGSAAGGGIPNIATGWRRNQSPSWAGDRPYLELGPWQ